jgi:hypothetical protein
VGKRKQYSNEKGKEEWDGEEEEEGRRRFIQ